MELVDDQQQETTSFFHSWPFKGGFIRDLFRGEKYLASIWVIKLGHDWKISW